LCPSCTKSHLRPTAQEVVPWLGAKRILI
jgi:hypothetical protein